MRKKTFVWVLIGGLIISIVFGTTLSSFAQRTTITYWDPDTREAWKEAWKIIISDFEKENPDIKIEVTNIPWGELGPKVLASLAAGTLPDMMYSFSSLAQNWAFQGATQPVTDIIKEIGEDQFSETMLLGVRIEGEYYAIPLATYPHILVYRKDFYQKAGLEVPESWYDVLFNVRKLHNPPDTYGILLFNKYPEPEILLDLMGLNNAATFDPEGNVVINSINTLEALEFERDLFRFSEPGIFAKSETDARLAFVDGLGAHMLTSPSFADILATHPDLRPKFGAVSFPINKGNRGPLAEFCSLNIAKTTKKREQIRKFLLYFYRPDNYLRWAQNTVIGHIPVVRSTLENREYWEYPRIKPFAEFIKAGMKASTGVLPGMTYGPNKFAALVLSARIWNEIGDRVCLKNEDPGEVLKWAQEQIENIIEEAK
ncbi:extracellular solute-binding protein [Candidatus Aerophobetes bacterium]|nr:extracellular solute-binding protein [Candidatus Aerophobetes bacterium]